MIYVALAELFLTAIILVFWARERDAVSAERQRLLDRIQHPEVRQVEPVHYEPSEAPKDTAEMAYVGQEVPEFIQVGENGAS